MDPRVAEPQGRGPPAILGEGGLCDPLEGWTRKDAALTDTFSIEQAAVDVTGAGLQLVEMGQPVRTLLHSMFDQPDAESVAAQYDRIIDALADKLPKVAEHLDATRADLLAFTAFPK